MLRYILYLNLKEEVLFHNELFLSFNNAKEEIDSFFDDYAKKRGKKIVFLSKEELEKLKLVKKPEDFFYIRKKQSEATIYSRITIPGTFYNSYSIEKYGNIGINEFLIRKADEIQNVQNIKDIKELHITNHERGSHVSLISELKKVLSKRDSPKEIKEIKDIKEKDDSFVKALEEGKTKLRSIQQYSN
jgi:hypothetical protein